MIIVDKEIIEMDTISFDEDKDTRVKIKKVYRLMRKIAENRIRGQTGES